MKEGSRTIRQRVAFVVAAVIAASALVAGSAQAASIGTSSLGTARIASAHDPAAAPGIVLVGFTSQNFPAFFKMTGDARKLTVGAISIELTCTSGSQFVIPDAFVRVRIGSGGQIHSTFAGQPTAGSDGSTSTVTDSLTARLNHRHTQLSGVWQLSVSFSFTNGMSDQCSSGPVRFFATA